MKTVVLLRGLPGSGKSTFVKENKLEPYTLSLDVLKSQIGSLKLDTNGGWMVDTTASEAFVLLQEILKLRFKRGVFTVIDATNLKQSDITKITKTAKEYNYLCYCVDFTTVISVDECVRRDALRPMPYYVGEKVIREMAKNIVPSDKLEGVKVVSPSEFRKIRHNYTDLSNYDKIHHIGDIHGCNTVLQEYMKDGIKANDFYIFLGDYIDRGIENVETLKYIDKIASLPNVVLLEGNHEKHLRGYVDDVLLADTEDFDNTRLELDTDPNMKEVCKRVMKKLKDCFFYKYNDKVVLCTHGGISKLPANLLWVSSKQMIDGVGQYTDMLKVNESFESDVQGKEVYQIHGHRNVEQVKMHVNSKCFNLNSNIEYGGHLRVLELDKQGFYEKEIVNPVYKQVEVSKLKDVESLMKAVSSNPNLFTKDYGDVFGIRYTKTAKRPGIWEYLPLKASCCYMSKVSNKIVARGTDVVYCMNERPELNQDCLINRVTYPLNAYLTLDGYIGVLGYNPDTDKLVYATRMDARCAHSDYFKDVLLSYVTERELKEYMKKHNYSLIFEVIESQKDKRVIEYKESKVVLIDVVLNELEQTKLNSDEVCKIANIFGLETRKFFKVFNTKEELSVFLDNFKCKNLKIGGENVKGLYFDDLSLPFFAYTPYYQHFKKLIDSKK